MGQAFYREYRPHKWEQVIGQEHIVHTLQNAIRAGRVGHAYLFAGPRGTGKTSTARLLAKAVNCLDADAGNRPCDVCAHCTAVNENRFLDLIEIDAASNTSVDDVRDLRDKINFSPTQGTYKVYIIDEVHMLSTAAFNALLKTLEEPPPHAIFILATTEVHKILPTVLSRCQRYEFRRIPVQDIVSALTYIAEQEQMRVEADALTLIARQSTGSLRDAISLLDQLTATGELITLSQVQLILGTATSQTVIDLVNAMLQEEPSAGMNCIQQALDSGTDARQFARQVVEYLRGLMLMRMGNADQVETTQEIRSQMARQTQAFHPSRLIHAIRLFNQAANEGRMGWQPGLMLELAFAELTDTTPSTPSQPPPLKQSAVVPAAASDRPAQELLAESPRSSPQPGLNQTPPAQIQTSAKKIPEDLADVSIQAAEKNSVEPPTFSKPTEASDQNIEAQNASAFQLVIQRWNQIRAAVKTRNSKIDALLNSCKPLGIRNGALVLNFQSDIVKSKMDTVENLEIACQAIAEVTGVKVRIRCIVNPKVNSMPADLEIESNGMVNEALNLGGKIVDKNNLTDN